MNYYVLNNYSCVTTNIWFEVGRKYSYEQDFKSSKHKAKEYHGFRCYTIHDLISMYNPFSPAWQIFEAEFTEKLNNYDGNWLYRNIKLLRECNIEEILKIAKSLSTENYKLDKILSPIDIFNIPACEVTEIDKYYAKYILENIDISLYEFVRDRTSMNFGSIYFINCSHIIESRCGVIENRETRELIDNYVYGYVYYLFHNMSEMTHDKYHNLCMAYYTLYRKGFIPIYRNNKLYLCWYDGKVLKNLYKIELKGEK